MEERAQKKQPHFCQSGLDALMLVSAIISSGVSAIISSGVSILDNSSEAVHLEEVQVLERPTEAWLEVFFLILVLRLITVFRVCHRLATESANLEQQSPRLCYNHSLGQKLHSERESHCHRVAVHNVYAS